MSKKFALIFAYGVLGSIFSFNVQAFPVLSPPEVVAAPDVELVRDFCGPRFHRDPWGHCVRDGTPLIRRRCTRRPIWLHRSRVRTATTSFHTTAALCPRV
jgi:hypothetical protein